MIRTIIFFITMLAPIVAPEARADHPLPQAAARKRIDIAVRQLSPIAFGTFASSDNGGTVTIEATSGARITTGAISTLSGGDYGQAEFLIIGQPGEEILVSPPNSVTLGTPGGGDMVITDFKIMPAEILTIDRDGRAKIKIGGTLKVPGNAAYGSYSSIFTVAVRYSH